MEAEAIVSSNQYTTRVCTKCPEKGPQPLIAFAKNPRPGKPDNRRTTCKTCCNEYHKNYKINPPPKRQLLTREEYRLKNIQWSRQNGRRNTLKRVYNLTQEEYQSMLEAQNGVCAICGQAETWRNQYGKICALSVDHDHKTGKVRGLLCNDCNRKVMMIESLSVPHLSYLKKHRSFIIVDLLS